MKYHIFKKCFLIVCLIITIFLVYFQQEKILFLLEKLKLINSMYAFLIFCCIYLLSNLLLLPLGLPLNFLAGILWGTFLGGIIVNLLATCVAAISFLLIRKFGQPYSEALFRHDLLQRFRHMIIRFDWQFIVMARLNPLVPFGLSNYLFGFIPNLSFRHYIIATVFANLFPCFIFSSIGSTVKFFPFDMSNIHKIMCNVGITLLLISGAVILKMWFHDKKQTSY